jgi:hypothetical protein
MVASPQEILTKWLLRYQLDQSIDRVDAHRIRFYVDSMTDDQRWQLVHWLRRRRAPHIESAWRESDQVAHRFEAFRSHLRRQAARRAVFAPDRHDALV